MCMVEQKNVQLINWVKKDAKVPAIEYSPAFTTAL